jgi:hypothetical protein
MPQICHQHSYPDRYLSDEPKTPATDQRRRRAEGRGWRSEVRRQRGENDHRKTASGGPAPRTGVPDQAPDDGSNLQGNANLEPAWQQRVWHPAGVQALAFAVVRRSPPQGTLGDARLPSGNPSGCLIQNVQTQKAGSSEPASRMKSNCCVGISITQF